MGLQFVLIHGAWHHGGHWEKVIEELEKAGHRAYAPTLLGNEPGAQQINHTMGETVKKLEADIKSQSFDDFILVGHSAGGPSAQQIAQLLPQRVKRVIFLSAFVLVDGESLNPYVNLAVEKFEDPSASSNFGLPVNPSLDWWQTVFANSVDSDTATKLHQTLVHQGGRMFWDTLDMKSFFELETPMSYISLTSDLVLGDPKNGQSWHPVFSSRLGSNYKLVEMAGDHEPMLTSPLLLAEKLIEASTAG